ncbi:hypothetical protein C0Q70_11770 [Pomacea canaliculata]|uniref:C-type lectin domain-containing protein n=1 Tax=Pomacea canaliculata TaxID=400727 RepID=A0A2T7P702_POMCA|nr:hypothetical protein C0Q70_11770 [Pomacea canaliculata]
MQQGLPEVVTARPTVSHSENATGVEELPKILSFGRRAVNLYIGLYTTVPGLDLMYSGVLQWVDETMAYYVQLEELDSRSGLSPMCMFIDAENTLVLSFVKCDVTNPSKFMCEFPKTNNVSAIPQTSPTYPVIIANNTPDSVQSVSFVKCSHRHVAIDFLSCAKDSNCDVKRDISMCELPGKGSFPMFKCDDNVQTIPYTLVCDYRPDCVDNSDENFCVIPECTKFLCRNQQCISFEQRCDGIQDCRDSSDESCGIGVERFISTIASPAVVHLAEGARQVKGMDAMVTKELVLKQMKVWIEEKILTVDETQ